MNEDQIKNTIRLIDKQLSKHIFIQIENKKPLFEYQEEKETFVKLTGDQSIIKSFIDILILNEKNNHIYKYVFYTDKDNKPVNEQDIQCVEYKYLIHETQLNQHNKFLNQNNIISNQWFEVQEEHLIKINDHFHNCDFYYKLNIAKKDQELSFYQISDLIKSIDHNIQPLISILSYDIETVTNDITRFPDSQLYSNKIVQIGLVFDINLQGKQQIKQILLTLGECDIIENVEVYKYKYELDLLKDYFRFLIKYNPDITIGYNIFGFDDIYIRNRVQIYQQISPELLQLETQSSRIQTSNIDKSIFRESIKDGANIGQNSIYQYDQKGQIRIDLMHQVKEQHKLDSYKLDNVSQQFIKGQVKNIDYENSTLITDSIDGLQLLGFMILNNDSILKPYQSKKIQILEIKEIKEQKITYQLTMQKEQMIELQISSKDIQIKSWGLCKDDISPRDIFKAFECKQNENKDEYQVNLFKHLLDSDIQDQDIKLRTKIGKYCIMDCYLVLILQQKLKTIIQTQAMSQISNIPYRFIFQNAQGIKLQSLVYRFCLQFDIIFTVKKYDKIKVEGAIVLDPIKDFYKYPIITLDYASLYPNCIITYNLSPDTFTKKEYPDNQNVDLKNQTSYSFVSIKRQEGLFPKILNILLAKRKEIRSIMKKNYDNLSPVDYLILDSQQLAVKVSANSLYGITGAQGALYFPQLTSSTTFFGRKAINDAKSFVQQQINMFTRDEKKLIKFCNDYQITQQIQERMINVINKFKQHYTIDLLTIYGDTDSIFVSPGFKLLPNKQDIDYNELTKHTIEFGQCISIFISKILPGTLDLQFEKTINHLCLFSKKHYIGWKHENVQSRSLITQGIVLKRRDNANIVKDFYRVIYDYIDTNNKNKNFQQDIIDLFIDMINQFINQKDNKQRDLKTFTISKTLAREYKNPDGQCHFVLSKRLENQHGMVFMSNERLPYIIFYDWFQCNRTKVLLGNVCQHPDYFDESFEIDYKYYIQQQIRKPLLELLDSVLNKHNKVNLKCRLDQIVVDIQRKRLRTMNNNYVNVYNQDQDLQKYIDLLQFNVTQIKWGKIQQEYNQQDEECKIIYIGEQIDKLFERFTFNLQKQQANIYKHQFQYQINNDFRVLIEYIYKFTQPQINQQLKGYKKFQDYDNLYQSSYLSTLVIDKKINLIFKIKKIDLKQEQINKFLFYIQQQKIYLTTQIDEYKVEVDSLIEVKYEQDDEIDD